MEFKNFHHTSYGKYNHLNKRFRLKANLMNNFLSNVGKRLAADIPNN